MRHCIETTDFSQKELLDLISLAKKIIDNPDDYREVCKGKKMATLFYEASTRTRMSFTAAMMDLGGNVLGFSDAQSSSVSKGETVADTTRIVSGYVDIIAMRHSKEGAPLVASQYGSVPVINAGDGSHAHPTQTLTDLLTISREIGRLDNLTIGLCGDLKYGRTVHSLIKAMSLFSNIKFVLISPENLRLPQYMMDELYAQSNLSYIESDNISDVIGSLDVLYMTRVQRERFADLAEYERCKDYFVLNKEIMALAKDDMIVLHPLPRVNEISTDVDNDRRAAYFRQAANGKFIRMALIIRLLEMAKAEKNKNDDMDKKADNLSTYKFYNPITPRISSELKESNKRCKHSACITQSEDLLPLEKLSNGNIVCAYCEHSL